MRGPATISRGPVHRATRRPPGRPDSHTNWTDRRGPVTGAGSSTAYAYNQAGNLTSYTPASGSASTYKYDGDGLRASKTVAGATTWTAWDTATGAVPLLLGDTSTQFYIYGPADTPIEQIKGSVNTYLMSDQLGSTIMLTGAGGPQTGTWTYDAYGNTTGHTGSGTTLLLYNGQYQDAESGLYYLRARLYDSWTAQFLSRDPLTWLTRDPYGYADEGPTNQSDPTGLSQNISDFGGEGGGGGGPGSGGEGGKGGTQNPYGEGGTAPETGNTGSEAVSGGAEVCPAVEGQFEQGEVASQNVEPTDEGESGRPSTEREQLKSISKARLKRILGTLGTDPHEFKEGYVGGDISRFDVKIGPDGQLWLENRDGFQIPTGVWP
jgi:RHS repeat-associated protein